MEHSRLNENRYRTFGPRLGAGFLDGVVLSLFIIGASSITYLKIDMSEELINSIMNYIENYLGIIYSILFHSLYGQTVGKMMTGVKVVTFHGENKIGFKHSILRDIVPLVAVLLFSFIHMTLFLLGLKEIPPIVKNIYQAINLIYLVWFILEIITMLTNKKRRALHDFIAGTVVVRT